MLFFLGGHGHGLGQRGGGRDRTEEDKARAEADEVMSTEDGKPVMGGRTNGKLEKTIKQLIFSHTSDEGMITSICTVVYIWNKMSVNR
jgi:hypothetical protein